MFKKSLFSVFIFFNNCLAMNFAFEQETLIAIQAKDLSQIKTLRQQKQLATTPKVYLALIEADQAIKTEIYSAKREQQGSAIMYGLIAFTNNPTK